MLDNYATITFEQAKEIMDNQPDYCLLDVRQEFEYITGHAEGARLIPLDQINEETVAEKIPSRDTFVITYCKSGKRASLAMKKLQNLGYKNVETVGSLVGWPYGISVEEEEYDF